MEKAGHPVRVLRQQIANTSMMRQFKLVLNGARSTFGVVKAKSRREVRLGRLAGASHPQARRPHQRGHAGMATRERKGIQRSPADQFWCRAHRTDQSSGRRPNERTRESHRRGAAPLGFTGWTTMERWCRFAMWRRTRDWRTPRCSAGMGSTGWAAPIWTWAGMTICACCTPRRSPVRGPRMRVGR